MLPARDPRGLPYPSLVRRRAQRHAQRQSLALRPMARRPAFPTRPVRSPLVSAGSHALLQGWPTGNGRSPLVKANLGESEIAGQRSEEHTSELQSLMRISYAVFCLKKKNEQEVKMYAEDSGV